jgi:hypothetical protein
MEESCGKVRQISFLEVRYKRWRSTQVPKDETVTLNTIELFSWKNVETAVLALPKTIAVEDVDR